MNNEDFVSTYITQLGFHIIWWR